MVYLRRGSLLLLPVARPSDALRNRSRSLNLHFLLPPLVVVLRHSDAMVVAEVEEFEWEVVVVVESEDFEKNPPPTPLPLRMGERDLDPFLLRLEEMEEDGCTDDFEELPVSLSLPRVASVMAAAKGSNPFPSLLLTTLPLPRGAHNPLFGDLGDRGEEEPALSLLLLSTVLRLYSLGGGFSFSGRIFPSSKSSSAVVRSGSGTPFSSCPLKSKAKSSTSSDLGDFGVPGFSSQSKGTAEDDARMAATREGLVGALV